MRTDKELLELLLQQTKKRMRRRLFPSDNYSRCYGLCAVIGTMMQGGIIFYRMAEEEPEHARLLNLITHHRFKTKLIRKTGEYTAYTPFWWSPGKVRPRVKFLKELIKLQQ